MLRGKKIAWLLAAVAVLAAATLLLVNRHRHTYGDEVPLGKDDRGYAFVKTCLDCGQETRTYYDALLTFLDSDGKKQALLHWERIMAATGIRMTAALIAGEVTETTDMDDRWAYAGWDLVERLQKTGMEFIDHSYSHQDLTQYTEAALHEELQRGNRLLESHGIHSSILLYPTNTCSDLVVSVVDDYFASAFFPGKQPDISGLPSEYTRTVTKINTANKKTTIVFSEDRIVDCSTIRSLDRLKEDMVRAYAGKDWLVYSVQAYDSPAAAHYFDESSEQTIIAFCRYVQSLDGIKIVTLSEGTAATAPLAE